MESLIFRDGVENNPKNALRGRSVLAFVLVSKRCHMNRLDSGFNFSAQVATIRPTQATKSSFPPAHHSLHLTTQSPSRKLTQCPSVSFGALFCSPFLFCACDISKLVVVDNFLPPIFSLLAQTARFRMFLKRPLPQKLNLLHQAFLQLWREAKRVR